MYQLDTPIYFYVFAIIPLLWFGYIAISSWKRRAQERFASTRLMEVLSPERSRFKPLLKLVLISLGYSCLILALVNPKIGTQLETRRPRNFWKPLCTMLNHFEVRL